MVINNKLVSGDYSSSFNKFVYDLIPNNVSCLDVGCWTGNLGSSLIKEKHCDVDGIDFKRAVLKKAKNRGYRNVYEVNFNNDILILVC